VSIVVHTRLNNKVTRKKGRRKRREKEKRRREKKRGSRREAGQLAERHRTRNELGTDSSSFVGDVRT